MLIPTDVRFFTLGTCCKKVTATSHCLHKKKKTYIYCINNYAHYPCLYHCRYTEISRVCIKNMREYTPQRERKSEFL